MVEIKGLNKARVLKALYDRAHTHGLDAMRASAPITVEHCAALLEKQTYFGCLYGRMMDVELSGDEFDERQYDEFCGKGAAQRAVDSVKDATEGGEGAAKEADGEKKVLTMEEKVKMSKDAIGKILDILTELPPDVATAAAVMLKMILPGPGPMGTMTKLLMMGGAFAPPVGGLFGAPDPFGRFGK